MQVAAQEYGLNLGMYVFEEKSIYFFLPSHVDSLIQVGQILGALHICLPLDGELCSVTAKRMIFSTHSVKQATHLSCSP